MISRLLCLAALISFLNSSSLAQSSSHPVTVDDYFQVKDVAEPQISSDGQWIAYTVTTATLKDDKNVNPHLDDSRSRRRCNSHDCRGEFILASSAMEPRREISGISLRAQRRQNASVVVGPEGGEAQQLTKQFKT